VRIDTSRRGDATRARVGSRGRGLRA
jgi:hypothetical protein